MRTITRSDYAGMFGPTTGDRVRLGDTGLLIEVEKDYARYGDELKFGGGKSFRDGMGQSSVQKDSESPDTVITNALVVDYTGIYKADIGIKNGKISAIGKAGNPQTMDGVTPGLAVGACTEAIAGEGLILTAGGTGPADGTNATTCSPGAFHIARMIEAAEAMPVNIAYLGKGNGSSPEPLREQIRAGAAGLKIHEDWGATPAVIDTCLGVADDMDVQVAIHTDTLNEGGCVEDTIAAFKGRTIHTYHTEGAGGGHAPDIIRAASFPNVLPSSTNPTMPFTRNTIDEHLDMMMVTHHLDRNVPEDIAFADSRIRPETIGAEDVLHDLGLISMMSSDSQAMGRVGEVITRTWQTADKMKKQRGPLPEDAHDNNRNDNFRVKRYVSKYTINPAITHGISDYVGSVEVGKMADLVLWQPALFGAKPEMIIKGGSILHARMGDANASIPTPEPVLYRDMFGAMGKALGSSCATFVSQAAHDDDIAGRLGLERQVLPVRHCRGIGKKDLKFNDTIADIQVNPETFQVSVDGEPIHSEPVAELPLAQRYFLF